MGASHPEFRLKRLMEDFCDTYCERRVVLKDKNMTEDDLKRFEGFLANHGDMARTMKTAMRDAIVLWKVNNAFVDEESEEAADCLEALLLHDDVPGSTWQPSKVEKVQLICEDVAVISPCWYGRERPGADYN